MRQLEQIADDIHAAATAVDLESAQRSAEEFAQVMRAAGVPPVGTMKSLIKALRRKRFFRPLQTIVDPYLAEAEAQGELAEIRLQLAQARIDEGMLAEAEALLLDLQDEYGVDTHLGREARGLLGRYRKQVYVNTAYERSVRTLREALKWYRSVTDEADPKDSFWHAINVVALLARAERDGIADELKPEDRLDWRQMAQEIFELTSAYPPSDGSYTWAAATAMEAAIALEREADANAWCKKYIDSSNADVFELGSTQRQLREVWQLDTRRGSPGALALDALSGRVLRLGGDIEMAATPHTLHRAKPSQSEDIEFQATYGDEKAVDVRWLHEIQLRCRSVALIYNQGFPDHAGSGFFASATSQLNRRPFRVDPDPPFDYFLFTNQHVLSSTGAYPSIRLEDAKVKLTMIDGQPEFRIEDFLRKGDAKLLVESPPHEYDVTIVGLNLTSLGIDADEPDFGLPLREHADLERPFPDGPNRLYVVGHPNGGTMKISLYDNNLIELDKPRLRYRSPTEAGQSGAPVLTRHLNTIAVHHAARRALEANQGILLDAICDYLWEAVEEVRAERAG